MWSNNNNMLPGQQQGQQQPSQQQQQQQNPNYSGSMPANSGAGPSNSSNNVSSNSLINMGGGNSIGNLLSAAMSEMTAQEGANLDQLLSQATSSEFDEQGSQIIQDITELSLPSPSPRLQPHQHHDPQQQHQHPSILHQQLVGSNPVFHQSQPSTSNYGRTVSVSSTESEYYEASPGGSENEVEVHTTTCGSEAGDEGVGPPMGVAGGGAAGGLAVMDTGAGRGDQTQDPRYWERRRKNNLAAKKSRDARRVRENQLRIKVLCLENANHVLRAQVTQEREENATLRERIRLLEENAAAALGVSSPTGANHARGGRRAARPPDATPSVVAAAATATPPTTLMEQETEEEPEDVETESPHGGDAQQQHKKS